MERNSWTTCRGGDAALPSSGLWLVPAGLPVSRLCTRIARGWWILLTSLVCLLVLPAASHAQTRWTVAGPEGGNVRALLVQGPGDVLAATYGAGLFRTTTGATTWTTGSAFCNFDTAALARNAIGSVFVGYYGGVCNSGSSVGTLANPDVRAVAVLGNHLFAGTSGGLHVIRYASASGSTPWDAAGLNTFIYALLSDEAGGTLYVAASDGLYEARLIPSTEIWDIVAVGAVSTTAYALASDGTHVYAVQGCTVRRKPLAGGAWQSYGPSICADQILAPDTSTLYATTASGVFKSIGGGAYTNVSTGLPAQTVTSLASEGASVVYAGFSGDGVYKTTNGGTSWARANAGLHASWVSGLADDDDGEGIYAATRGAGLFRSTDQGQSWFADGGGIDGLSLLTVISEYGTTLVGTEGRGVYRRNDVGASWTPASTGIGAFSTVGAFGYSYNLGAPVFFAAANTADRVHVSNDLGATWTAAGTGITAPVTALAVASGTVAYAGTAGGGVFRTLNGGTSWAAPNVGLTDLTVKALVLTGGGTLYAGTANGLFVSTTGASSWTRLGGAPISNILAVTLDADLAIYIGGEYSTHVSRDGGTTWTNVGPGRWVHSLQVVSSPARKQVYAGIIGGVRVLDAGVPALTQVSPAGGPTAGGTAVTLSGAEFVQPFTTVRFGGVAATNVVVSSNTSLTATTPAGVAGPVGVTVETGGGQVALPGGFTYGPTYALTVSLGGLGSGTVSSSPGGIACGPDCGEEYVQGTVVTLTASPAVGSLFAGWAGGVCSGTGTCQVTMGAARSVTANFDRLRQTLDVTRSGSGSGTVTASPSLSPFDTGYLYGTVVTLTPGAAAGSAFTGWSGACAGTGACQITMDADRAVTATFEARPVLRVTRTGSGLGTVSSDVAGIDCGADCSETYAGGTLVTLTASPSPGAVFAGWSGPCSGGGVCQVTMSTSRDVRAAFNALGERYVFSHMAGTFGGPGSADGTGGAARFHFPMGVAVDGAGNAYVADTTNHTIRKITPAGVVTTLAGLAGAPGSADGSGADARFNEPSAVAVDAAGTVYVADASNRTIRRITAAGAVTTLAGTAGLAGASDGIGAAARFQWPQGIAVDATGTVYVADAGNQTVRKITPAALVTTLAGLAGALGSADGTGADARFSAPRGVTVDAAGTVYVADSNNHAVRKITSTGVVTTLAGLSGNGGAADGAGSDARFYLPSGVAVDASGIVYVGDTGNNTVRRVTQAGVVTTLAGLAGSPGSVDGAGSAGRFFGPWGVAVDAAAVVFVADANNHGVRRVSPAGQVTTHAGAASEARSVDGTGSAARFRTPAGVAVDGVGGVRVADSDDHTIRRVTAARVVTTLAGQSFTFGGADGTGSAARFYFPSGVAIDAAGVVFVADTVGHVIRRVSPEGVVTTAAGLFGSSGSTDGTQGAARFRRPEGVAVDPSGNVYVADALNHTIRKITPGGTVSTVAGLAQNTGAADGSGSAARFNGPAAVAVDGAGNLYVADRDNHTIRKITAEGVVTTLAGQAGVTGSADGAGSAARFNRPLGVAVDAAGTVFVTDSENHTIRKVTPAGEVTTVAGLAGTVGNADGAGSSARFSRPWGIAVDTAGRLYVGDSANHSIRLGVPDTPQPLVVTRGGSGTGTLSSSPAGISCGADCSEAYPFDTLVTLTAQAGPGSTFAGWTGACGGTGSCQVSMAGARNVTATFEPAPGAPAITGVAPATGPTAGGTTIVITGVQFGAGATVTVGGRAALDVVVASATTIQARTPAGTAGPALVVVTTATGTATLTGGFRYEAASVRSAGTATREPALSGDGRYLVFVSAAALGDADTNGLDDIYVRDRVTAATTRLSRGAGGAEADGASTRPRISADGRFVAFVSAATNLVGGDTNGAPDVFLHDRDADGNGVFDEAGAWTTRRVSVASTGAQGGGASGEPDLSADGQWVAFVSAAADLVAGDTNGAADVFLHHWPSGQTTRVSVASGGGQANGPSRAPGVSRGGRRVVFASDATNLVADDGNGVRDVFLHERASGQTTRVSVPDAEGVSATGPSDRPSIDDAGLRVAFQTQAGELGGTPGRWQIVLRVLPAETAPVGGGLAAEIVCIRCRLLQIISQTGQGTAGGGDSTAPEISGGGGALGFESEAPDLEDGDGNGQRDVFVSQLDGEGTPVAIDRVSVDQQGNEVNIASQVVALSADGRSVAFEAAGALTEEAPDDGVQVYLRTVSLVVGRLDPAFARADVSDTVAISGAGFQPGVQVRLGATPVETLFDTEGSLRVRTPTGVAVGAVDVTVTNPDGGAQVVPGGFTFVGADPPQPSPAADADGDGLPDAWETRFGLNPAAAGGADGGSGDPDADGQTNAQELAAGTHPRSLYTRYLAEGATGSLFVTRVALANPSSQAATALVRFQRADGAQIDQAVTIPPRETRKVTANGVAGLQAAEFSTVVESDRPLAVTRTMWWDPARVYGSHNETSVATPATTWYLAEGSTNAGFQLFYLIQNPGATAAAVEVTFLLPSGAPVERRYTVAPGTRFNIWVNTIPELSSTDVSAVVRTTNGVPIIVERAMYLDRGGLLFGAGHEAAGVTEPARSWFLAEGATGPYFDLYVLLANPGLRPAQVTATYLRPDGRTITKVRTVPAQSRVTVPVDLEDAALANTAVSTTIVSDEPILVERAMWWPGGFDTWHEAHTSFGATVTGTLWGMGEGVVNGPPLNAQTYVLVANTSPQTAQIAVSVLFADGTPAVTREFSVGATSRFNVDLRAAFPEAVGKEFGVVVESLPVGGQAPAPIVVEQAIYNDDATGVSWAAGSNALATRLR